MIGAGVTQADRKLLGGGRLQGPMPFVIAVMMFVMVMIAAAGLALANSARMTAGAIENRHTLQAAGEAEQAGKVLAVVRGLPGVTKASQVSVAEMRKTLGRWMGPDASSEDLPLPLLIELELAPDADRSGIEKAARSIVPSARIVSHRASLQPITTTFRTLGWLALALVLLTALATAAAVVLATRGALDTHRATIEVMHGVGATDEQIARLFQRKMAIDALVGGTIGAVAAGIILLLLAGGASSFLGDLSSRRLIGMIDIALLAALPLAGTAIAAVAARYSVMRKLEQSP